MLRSQKSEDLRLIQPTRQKTVTGPEKYFSDFHTLNLSVAEPKPSVTGQIIV